MLKKKLEYLVKKNNLSDKAFEIISDPAALNLVGGLAACAALQECGTFSGDCASLTKCGTYAEPVETA